MTHHVLCVWPQVRRHCEDREQEVRALRARVAALEAALLDKTRAGQHTTGVGGRVSAGGGHPDAMGTLGVGQREAGQSELLRAADSAQPNDAMDIEELCLSRPSQDKDQLLDTPTPTATPAATRGASPLSEEGWSDGGGEEEWWGCKRARISDFMGMCLGAEGGEGAGAAGAGVGVGGDDGDCGALVEAQQHPLMVQSGVHQVPDPLAPWLFAPSSPLPPLAPSPLLPLQQPQEPLPPAGAPCMPGAPALPSLSLGPTSQCPRSNLTATPNTPHTATLNNAGIPTPFSPALWGAQQQQQPAAPTLAREGVSAFSQCATAPSPPQSTAAPSRHDSNTPGAPPLCGPSHHRLGPEAVAAGATPRSDYIPDYSWQNDVKIGGIFDMPGPDHLPLMVPGGGMSMDGDAAVSQHPEALGAEAGKVGRGGRGFGRASLPRVAPAPAHMLGLHPMSRSHSTPNIPLLGEGGGAGGGLGMTRGLGGGALGKAGLGRIQGAAPIGSSSTNLPCVPAVAPHTLKANNRRGGQGRNSGRGSSLAVMTRSASLQPSDGRSGTPAMRGSGGGSLTQGPGAAHVGMGACGNDMGGMGFGAASGQACTKLGPGPTGGIVGVPAVGVGPVVGGNMARHVVPVGAGAGPQDETAQGGDGSDRIVNALAAQLEGMQRLQRFQAEQAKLQAQQLEQLRQALTRHMVAEPSL